jgi:hypothetical protein
MADDNRFPLGHVEDRIGDALPSDSTLLEAPKWHIAWPERPGAVDNNSTDL